MAFLGMTLLQSCSEPLKKAEAQVISPTACGALFSARTTPQPSQNLMEPSWNPGGTLVEPWWNLTSRHPEPIWAETPKLSAVGEKLIEPQDWKLGLVSFRGRFGPNVRHVFRAAGLAVGSQGPRLHAPPRAGAHPHEADGPQGKWAKHRSPFECVSTGSQWVSVQPKTLG